MTTVAGHQVGMESRLGESLAMDGLRISCLFGHAAPPGFILTAMMTARTGFHAHMIKIIPNGVECGVSLGNLMAESLLGIVACQTVAIRTDQPGTYMGVIGGIMECSRIFCLSLPVTLETILRIHGLFYEPALHSSFGSKETLV